MSKHEIAVSEQQLEQMLSSISSDTVLVGGQALAFWVAHFNINMTHSPLIGAISNDADFLGRQRDVGALAQTMGGSAELLPQRAITALVGQVKVRVSEDEFINIDVIHRVVGITNKLVRQHAVQAELGSTCFSVMHPLHVLRSRVENLSQLTTKQNEQGIEQTRLALSVANAYIRDVATETDSRSVGQATAERKSLNAMEEVVSIAKSGAGRRVARDFGIDFFAALPSEAITNEDFARIRWPQIFDELTATNTKAKT